jgi:hypothetical protein
MKKQKWWMVFNPYPEGKKPTVRHETLHSAKVEAERISMSTGRKIHILELYGTYVPPSKLAEFVRAETTTEKNYEL